MIYQFRNHYEIGVFKKNVVDIRHNKNRNINYTHYW